MRNFKVNIKIYWEKYLDLLKISNIQLRSNFQENITIKTCEFHWIYHWDEHDNLIRNNYMLYSDETEIQPPIWAKFKKFLFEIEYPVAVWKKNK